MHLNLFSFFYFPQIISKWVISMLYRKMGKTGKEVSILGFGCMRFQIEGDDVKNIKENIAIEQIRYAIDNGVNYIDTAYPYHGGMSEPLVAKALKEGYRDKVYLATKLPSWLINSREDMDKYLNEQLEKLETDHIDFYLLHALNQGFWDNLLKHNVFDFVKKALANERIKHIGFSFHDELPLFKEIIDYYDWDFCQIQYNYMDEEYQAGKEGLEYAAAKGMGVIIMEPLRGGSLTAHPPKVIREEFDSAPVKRTPAEWALRFIWDHPEVSLVLSGMNEMIHIEENMKCAGEAYPNSLLKEERELIDNVKKTYLERILVHCTKCKYCMPCPAGVDIPGNFSIYNDSSIYNDLENHRKIYAKFFPQDKKAVNCVECGVCEDKCPQNIEIRKMLKQVTETLG